MGETNYSYGLDLAADKADYTGINVVTSTANSNSWSSLSDAVVADTTITSKWPKLIHTTDTGYLSISDLTIITEPCITNKNVPIFRAKSRFRKIIIK